MNWKLLQRSVVVFFIINLGIGGYVQNLQCLPFFGQNQSFPLRILEYPHSREHRATHHKQNAKGRNSKCKSYINHRVEECGANRVHYQLYIITDNQTASARIKSICGCEESLYRSVDYSHECLEWSC